MGTGIHQPVFDSQVKLLVGIVSAQNIVLQRVDVSLPKRHVHSLLCLETGAIPIAGEKMFAREDAANLRMREISTFKGAFGHDIQKHLEGR